MKKDYKIEKGWKPLPLSFKILFVTFIFWSIGSVLNLSNLYESGLPFFGVFVYGVMASIVAVFLDIVGPMTFLYALWNRKSWGVIWAFSYIGFFILNGMIALFTVSKQIGIPQIIIPKIASIIFLIVIYRQKSYFK
jgi:hypothetical protein